VGPGVHFEHAANHLGIAVEGVHPVIVTEDKDGFGIVGIVARNKASAVELLDAENIEEIPRHHTGLQP